MLKRFGTTAAAVLLASAAMAQINLSGTGYYNFKTKERGAVLLTKIDSLHKVGLDLSVLIGESGKNPAFTDLTGTVGLSLSGTWTYPKSPWYGSLGYAFTCDSAWHFGDGVILSVGVHF